MTHGSVRLWLRLEGLAVLGGSVSLYAQHGRGWLLFLLLFLAPDLSLGGYLADSRAGAAIYNIAHSYVLPVGIALAASLWGPAEALPFVLIWTAHIGFDRLLGYGLKYPTGFGDTHLGPLGRGRALQPSRPGA